jgi:TM2 domain-containing membrane protein YozV
MDIDLKTKELFDKLTQGDKDSFIKKYELQKKQPWIYYLCLIFLGQLGVNRFYLDQIGMGMLYIFTSGIVGIGLIYDLFTGVSQVRAYNERLCARIINDYPVCINTNPKELNAQDDIPKMGLM